MILESKELQEIESFINGYKSINFEFENIEEAINNLREKQERLTYELEDLRSKENTFSKFLKNKYGEGVLNLETFEYELKK